MKYRGAGRKSWLDSANWPWSAPVYASRSRTLGVKEFCRPIRTPRTNSHGTYLRLISPLPHRPRRPRNLSTSLARRTLLVFISQHVISLMESSSRVAQLQNAIGTTVSGRAQIINAGRDVILPSPLPAAGTSRFYDPSIPLI